MQKQQLQLQNHAGKNNKIKENGRNIIMKNKCHIKNICKMAINNFKSAFYTLYGGYILFITHL